jgi:two-component system sensor kinase FixL
MQVERSTTPRARARDLAVARLQSDVQVDASAPAGWEGQVLQALDVSAAVLAVATNQVLWKSTAFERLVGGDCADVVALCQHLGGLDVALATASTTPRTVALRRGKRAIEATLLPQPDGTLVLKLEDLVVQMRERQRHLEDREQLLFTSRLLSIGEMATTLAHEINQPIGAAANLLRGTVMRLQRQAEGETVAQPAVLQALQRATEQVLFAAKVIARIREYTPVHTPKRVRVDLGALLRSCVSLLDWETEREQVRVELDLPAEPLWTLADEVMLQQLFVNLMRNAIDAMRGNAPDDRHLTISARREGPQAEVTVCDCGSGIDEEQEQKLFVPFVSSKPTGTGIGLNICRSFVELHQGRLWFSRNPVAGTSFHAALPMISVPQEEEAV